MNRIVFNVQTKESTVIPLTTDEISANEISRKEHALNRKKQDAKTEARNRIIALIPNATEENFVTKELNLLLRGVRLVKKKDAGTLTTDENVELDNLDAMGAKIEEIKAASNLIEQDVDLCQDPVNFDVVNSPRWPG